MGESGAPRRIRRRDEWDVLLNPTFDERIWLNERDLRKLTARMIAVEELLAVLTKPKVAAIYPNNPWRNIADARMLLARQVEDGTVSETDYSDAMANLAASEQRLNRLVKDLDHSITELRRGHNSE